MRQSSDDDIVLILMTDYSDLSAAIDALRGDVDDFLRKPLDSQELSATLERGLGKLRLMRDKRKAESANRAKSEFLATMSHELRTPLNVIIGFADLLKAQVSGKLNVKQAQHMEHIMTSSLRLLELINDILDLSKIEAGRLVLELEEFDVVSTLQAIENIIKPVADEKRISLALEVQGDAGSSLPPIEADPAKFKQIFYNLLSNSVRFTPDGGRVTLKVSCSDDSEEAQSGDFRSEACRFFHIAVADTGIGIKGEDQERIFESFTQVDSSYSRQQQGTGLGLSLTRKLVELHGGRLRVESEGEGKGSTFTVVLPAEAQMTPVREGAEKWGLTERIL